MTLQACSALTLLTSTLASTDAQVPRPWPTVPGTGAAAGAAAWPHTAPACKSASTSARQHLAPSHRTR